ncbi:MAG TPA: hypothetical protein EYQ81_16305, partial [Sneathiellales bacterium]|nr:hypothetical protein [Sneathiellales bacterium]
KYFKSSLLKHHRFRLKNIPGSFFGLVTGGYLLSKSAIAALAQSNGDNSGDEFHISRIAIAQFYANQIMPQSLGLVGAVMSGDSTLYTMSPEQMAN